MNDESALSFERAQYEGGSDGSSTAPCGQCGGALSGRYWTLHGKVLCEACRGNAEQAFHTARTTASVGKALLLGGLTAMACGVAYATFVAFTDYQLALITIGIAFAVATVVRRASQGLGGRRFQVIALSLTYFASAMGYAPAVWSALKGADETSGEAQAATEDDGSLVPPESKPAVDAASADDAAAGQPVTGLQIVLAMLFMVGLVLAAPLLSFAEAPIGFLIVLFGLWEAWKLTRAADLTVEGPFHVEAQGVAS